MATKERWERIGIALSVMCAVVAAVYGIVSFIDDRIEQKLTDGVTLEKVAALVRPSCIIDEKGRILFDGGAMRHIDEIVLENPKIDDAEWFNGMPQKITISANRYLAHAPLVSPIDPYWIIITAERGSKFSWTYTLEYSGATGYQPFNRCRFRIELL